ncbi:MULTISPECIES: hypothetical protein [Acidithiobacillus]|uniref:Cyclic nucleotide-binding domain-containing protein n=1 Tax=Acidithiobacillus ferrivorans TaxID=160808 RepID=A0A7T5BGU4_9PROT|nr:MULTISPECIES: hypothetical protein [Acidithiobacillus]MCR2829019.1 hypothetical protein [Acidithiobacillus ferrooxidans]QQD72699.1 hypothetical protein H2515_15330 [Acidithiobacillus ferrivorans]
MDATVSPIALSLDGSIAALFVVLGLGVMVSRQMLGTLRFFMWQSVALTASALVLADALQAINLLWVALITFSTKVIAVPLVLRWAAGEEIYGRREVDQALSISASVLVAATLALVGWFAVAPVLPILHGTPFAQLNLPTGLIMVLWGAFTVALRRESVAQLMGLLIMENGAFFGSIAIVHNLTVIAEIAAAVDVPIVALVIGLLIRSIRRVTGTTRVGGMDTLHER